MDNPDRVKRIVRFLLIGGSNTLIDFGILFFLTGAGVHLWFANMISTSVALVYSYFANRSFTFRAGQGGLSQALKFLGVTLFGLWALQPLTMQGVMLLLPNDLSASAVLLIAKTAATGLTLVWNFVLYQNFVFAKPQKKRIQ